MRASFPRFQQFLAARLSPAEVYGLHLSAGLALFLATAGLFAAIAHLVMSGAPLTLLDLRIAQHFHTYAGSPWTGPMLFLTHAHASLPLLAAAGLFCAWLWARREPYWVLAVATTVPGGMALNNLLLKNWFERPRPQFDEPLVVLSTYSFPSGHAAGSTLLYGVLAAYAVSRLRSPAARIAAGLAACAMPLLVSLSRVYLGAHYLSDVLAGITVGIGWLAICLSATATLRRRRMHQG